MISYPDLMTNRETAIYKAKSKAIYDIPSLDTEMTCPEEAEFSSR